MKEDSLKEVAENSVALLNYVIDRYGIKTLDDFTCPHHRKLAESILKIGGLNEKLLVGEKKK
jgi:hypothetical protein